MIPKDLNTGKGIDPLGYICGLESWSGETRPFPPEILAGDPASVDALIRQSRHKQKYVSIVLSSYEQYEARLAHQVETCLRSFDDLFFAALDRRDFVPMVSVLHRRKIGFDIHCVILSTHLLTGQQVAWWNHNRDSCLFWIWARLQNLVYGWRCPSDPRYWTLRTEPSNRLSSPAWGICETLDIRITEAFESGVILDRASLVTWLPGIGVKVLAETNDTVVVELVGSVIELRGRKYRVDFSMERYIEQKKEAFAETLLPLEVRIASLRKQLDPLVEHRAKDLSRRYAGKQIISFAQSRGMRISSANLARHALPQMTPQIDLDQMNSSPFGRLDLLGSMQEGKWSAISDILLQEYGLKIDGKLRSVALGFDRELKVAAQTCAAALERERAAIDTSIAAALQLEHFTASAGRQSEQLEQRYEDVCRSHGTSGVSCSYADRLSTTLSRLKLGDAVSRVVDGRCRDGSVNCKLTTESVFDFGRFGEPPAISELEVDI